MATHRLLNTLRPMPEGATTYKNSDIYEVFYESDSLIETYKVGKNLIPKLTSESRAHQLKLRGLKTQAEITADINNMGQLSSAQFIPVLGTVLPQGLNVPSYITSKGKAELIGGDGGTTFTQSGGSSTTVTEGYLRMGYYDRDTDLWTFDTQLKPLPTSPLNDTLTSTSTTVGLTANQGRILNDKTNALRADISETIAKVFTTTLPVVRFSSQTDLTTPDTNQTIVDANTLRVVRANTGGANTVMYANTGIVLNQLSKKVSARYLINSEVVSGSGILLGYGTIDNIPTSVPHGFVWRSNGQLFFVDPYSAPTSLPSQPTYIPGDTIGFDYEIILNGSTVIGGRFRTFKNGIVSEWYDDNATFRGNLLVGFRGGFNYDLTIGTENSNSLLAQSKTYTDVKVSQNSQKLTFYVDKSVVNTGNGGFSTPFKTISEAINAIGNNKNISILIKGGVYRESVNLSDKTELDLEISNYNNLPVWIQGSEAITGWTKTVGYSNIYEVPYSNTIPTQVRDGRRLFEYGRSSMVVSVDERHRLQKGLLNRLPYTEIQETTATGTLSDILTNLDGTPSRFYTVGGILYIHVLDGTNPASNSNFSIENQVRNTFIPPTQKRNVNITLNFIGTLFSSNYGFDGLGFNKVYRRHVTVLGSRNNGFADDIGTTKAYWDESGGCGNDGASGHFNRRPGGYTGLDIRFGMNQNFYFEPWYHDNRDDGISHHALADFSGIGGLFEYNGKAGLIPANGANCSWIGGLSRGNVVAGVYVGNALDPTRAFAVCRVENFISENNGTNFRVSDDVNWVLELINCYSRNAVGAGYRCAKGVIKATNCRSYNDAFIKLAEDGGVIQTVSVGDLI